MDFLLKFMSRSGSRSSSSVVLNSIHLEGQGRQPPLAATSCHRPATTCNRPAASHQLYAASRQPPSHLKVEISCFEFVYK